LSLRSRGETIVATRRGTAGIIAKAPREGDRTFRPIRVGMSRTIASDVTPIRDPGQDSSIAPAERGYRAVCRLRT
jgi:hypothetical protein